MANPPHDQPPLREAIASRLQARFEAFNADGEATSEGAAPAVAPSPVGASRAGRTTTPWSSAPRGGNLQAQFSHLNQQFQVLREQLDAAFDDVEDRLDDLESRVHLAETRASVAEARASVAETRAADAEARATGAHRRIDEVLALFEQMVPRRPMALEDAPESGALERLHELRRQAEGG
jgi:hypothetical protein